MVKFKQLKCALENEDHFLFVFLRRGPKENGSYIYYERTMTLNELLSHLSGGWRIEHNFHFKLKDYSTDHFEILPGNKTDANAVRKEIGKIAKIIHQYE